MLLLHWEVGVLYEVGVVTRCGKSTSSLGSLVDRTLVGMASTDLLLELWNDPNGLHWGEKNLGHGFVKRLFSVVPSGSLYKETVNVHSIGSWFLQIGLRFIRNNGKVPGNGINWNGVLSCVVLFCTCKERLGEEET